MKFDDAKTPHSDDQRELFKQMFGEKYLEMELGEDCKCDDDPKRRKKRPATKEEKEKFVEELMAAAKEKRRQLEEATTPSLLERLTPSTGTVLAGAGLIAVGAAAIFFGPELLAAAGLGAAFAWVTQ
jgi:TATA-binding protein-associated factor Taf7